MTEPLYNLIDEPWIGVLSLQGEPQTVSLAELFTRAEELQGFNTELPTMTACNLRLCVAIMFRALDYPETVSEWEEAVGDWKDAAQRVVSYLQEHHDRFYLVHPTAPFYQCANLETNAGVFKEMSTLICDIPANVPLFTTRGPQGSERVTLAEAAQLLLHAQSFDVSGIKPPHKGDPRAKAGKLYPQGQAWCGYLDGVYPLGETLAETLRLNYFSPEVLNLDYDPDEDLPVWERDPAGPLPEFPEGTRPAGPAQLLTWQSRRIRLHVAEGFSDGVMLTYGDQLSEKNCHAFEPFSTYRFSEPQSKKAGVTVFMPGMVDSTRHTWREFSAWLPTSVQPQVKKRNEPTNLAPPILDWVGTLSEDSDRFGLGFAPNVLSVGIVYGPQNATYADMVSGQLAYPAFLQTRDGIQAARVVEQAISIAEMCGAVLGYFGQNLAIASGVDREESGPYRDQFRLKAFEHFESLFEQWISTVTPSNGDAAAHEWQRTLLQCCNDLAVNAANKAGTRALFARSRNSDETAMSTERALAMCRATLRKHLPLATKEQS